MLKTLINNVAGANASEGQKLVLVGKLVGEKFRPKTRDDVESVLKTAADCFQFEASDLHRKIGQLLVGFLGKLFADDLRAIVTDERLSDCLPVPFEAGQVAFVHALLHAMNSIWTAVEMMAKLTALRPALEVVAKAEYTPPAECQLALLRLWLQFPACLPRAETFLCETLVSWVAILPCKTFAEMRDTVALFARAIFLQSDFQTRDAQDRHLSDVLMTIFAFLGGARMPTKEDNDEPSPCLCLLLEHCPLKAPETVVTFIAQVAAQFGGSLGKALPRVLQWPMTPTIAGYADCFLQGLVVAKKVALLGMLAHDHSKLLLEQLHTPEYRDGALRVMKRLLFGAQHTPEAFHSTLPGFTAMLRSWVKPESKSSDVPQKMDATPDEGKHAPAKMQDDAKDENAVFRRELSYTLHCLMYHHHGFPVQYFPVIELLTQLKAKALLEQQMRDTLAEYRWSADGEMGETYGELSARGKFAGLRNLGNTCYANSVVQMLFLCDTYRQATLTQDAPGNSTLAHLQQLFAYQLWTRRPYIEPNAFVGSLPSRYRSWLQQDAQEFACYLIKNCADAPRMKGKAEQKSDAPMPDVMHPEFGGMLRSAITCSTCGFVSNREEIITDLPLSVPAASAALPLSDPLDTFFAAENLSGYFCGQCKQKRDAVKRLSLARSPGYLLLLLKRHEYNAQTQGRTKIMTEVKTPAALRVADDSGPADYVLSSAVIHSGSSAQSGHYYTIGRALDEPLLKALSADPSAENSGKLGSWSIFNDSTVSPASFAMLDGLTRVFPTDVAYVLCYRRLSVAPVAANARLPLRLQELVEADNQRYVTELSRPRAVPGNISEQYAQFRGYYDPER